VPVTRFTAALLALLALTGSSRAGYMTQSGVVGFWGSGDPAQTAEQANYQDFWNLGLSGSSASGSIGRSAASASVNLHPLGAIDAGIHLSNSASSPTLAYSNAAGEWVDVIRVGGGPAPTSIRIGIEVEGSVQLALDSGTAAVAVGVKNFSGSGLVGTSESGPQSVPPDAMVAIALTRSRLDNTPQLGVGSTGAFLLSTPSLSGTTVNGAVRWDAYFNLTYDPTLGGYQVNLYAGSRALAEGGSAAQADFSHTIRLTEVTAADGSALPGAVTFDSGFSLNSSVQSVPAPPGSVLAGVGVVMLLGRSWLRRRLVPVVA